jgi:hypothetical protein
MGTFHPEARFRAFDWLFLPLSITNLSTFGHNP